MHPPNSQRDPAVPVVLVFSLLVFLSLGVLLSRTPATSHSAGDSWLPLLNALLNGSAGLCLLFGYAAIRRRHVDRHRSWMLAAAALSTAFLVSYTVHHARVGSVPFVGPGWLRAMYLAILLPHVVLSAVLVPMVPLTLWWGWKRTLDRHRRLARWTLPVWLLVSVTGVLVYAFVYHWNAAVPVGPGAR